MAETCPEPKQTIRRNIFSLGAVSLFTDISTEMLYPLMPGLVKSLGGSPSALGLIEGVAESTASILKGFSGYLSDRFRKRKIFTVLGYSISAISKPLIGLSTAWPMVLALRFCDRVGKGIRTAPRDAIVADSCAPEEMGKWFGFHRAMDTLGAALGPLLAFILLGIGLHFRKIFLWSIVPAFIAVLILGIFVRELAPSQKEPGKKFQLDFRGLNRSYHLYLLISSVFVLGNFSNVFLIQRAQELGMSLKMSTLLYLVYNLVCAFVSIPAGMRSDRVGRKRVLLFSFLLCAVCYLGFGYNQNKNWLWLLFSVFGAVEATRDGVQRALIGELVPSEKRASAYGIYYSVTGLLMFASSTIAGLVWKKFGADVVFYYGAGLTLLAAILLFFLLPHQINSAPRRITN